MPFEIGSFPAYVHVLIWGGCVVTGMLLAWILQRAALLGRPKASTPMDQEMSALLTPLKAQLEDFKLAQAEMTGVLTKDIDRLNETHLALAKQTNQLTGALKGSATMQGNWGEMQLRACLEAGGLLKELNFVEQPNVPVGDVMANPLRPDVILSLPHGGQLVIDAKAPLKAYLEANEAEDHAVRQQANARLVSALKRHVEHLASKRYWAALPQSPDFVVMFLPIDQILAQATLTEPALFDIAARARVLIVTPTSLLGLAKTIAFTWRQSRLESSAARVMDKADDIYRSLGDVAQSFGQMGKSLKQSVAAYNELLGVMESKILPSARMLSHQAHREASKTVEARHLR